MSATTPSTRHRRRRWALLPVAALVAALALPVAPASAAPATVTFGDAVVRAAVNTALGRAASDESPVATDALSRVTNLATPSGAAGAPTSLDGLQYATALRSLSLVWNAPATAPLDLTPIAGLTSLTSLSLEKGGINDLAPLRGLRNLTELTLTDNAIEDLAPLSGLVKLQGIALPGNRITATEPLAPLTAVTRLALGWNPIGSLSGLRNMTKLYSVNIPIAKITDISPLKKATALNVLRLSGNQVTDLSPLTGMTQLTLLWVDDNRVTDLSPVATLTSMNSLGIGKNDIADLSPLAGLTGLRELNVESNRITDISPVPMTGLSTFKLANNRVADISSFAALADNRVLSDFDLSGNRIADLRPLAALPATGALRSVSVGGQQLDSSGTAFVPVGAEVYRRPVVAPSIQTPAGEPVQVDGVDAEGVHEWAAVAGATTLPYSVAATVTVGGVAAVYTATSSYAVAPADIVTTLAPAAKDEPYRATLAVSAGMGPVSFEGDELPEWLSLAADGTLSGTPPAAGVTALKVRAVDPYGNVIGKTVSLTVADAALLPATPGGTTGGAGATGGDAGVLASTGADLGALPLVALLALLAGVGVVLARRRSTV